MSMNHGAGTMMNQMTGIVTRTPGAGTTVKKITTGSTGASVTIGLGRKMKMIITGTVTITKSGIQTTVIGPTKSTTAITSNTAGTKVRKLTAGSTTGIIISTSNTMVTTITGIAIIISTKILEKKTHGATSIMNQLGTTALSGQDASTMETMIGGTTGTSVMTGPGKKMKMKDTGSACTMPSTKWTIVTTTKKTTIVT